MEIAFTRMNIVEFYDRIVAGLGDEHDIRALCNLMLTKLIVLDPDETQRRLDAIGERFRAILSTKLKDNAVKQEIEKADETNKGVLRVSVQLQKSFPAASSGASGGQHQMWRTYWEYAKKEFSTQVALIESESRQISAA
jgi:cullin-associated NEDD8-dissociated protein 1